MGLAHAVAPKGTLPESTPDRLQTAEEPAIQEEEGSVAQPSAASMAVGGPAEAGVPVDGLVVGFAMAGRAQRQAFVALMAGKSVLAGEGWDNCDQELPLGLAALAVAVVAGVGWGCNSMRRSDHC